MTETPTAPPGSGGGQPGPAERPVWPTVIGVLSMVLAGLIVLAMFPTAVAYVGTSVPLTDRDRLRIARLLVRAGLAVFLACAGLGLTHRRTWAAWLHLICGALKVLHVVWPIGWSFAQFWRDAGPQVALTMLFYSSMYALAGLAYPVFLTVWFLRPSIRRQVRAWRRRSDPAGGT